MIRPSLGRRLLALAAAATPRASVSLALRTESARAHPARLRRAVVQRRQDPRRQQHRGTNGLPRQRRGRLRDEVLPQAACKGAIEIVVDRAVARSSGLVRRREVVATALPRSRAAPAGQGISGSRHGWSSVRLPDRVRQRRYAIAARRWLGGRLVLSSRSP